VEDFYSSGFDKKALQNQHEYEDSCNQLRYSNMYGLKEKKEFKRFKHAVQTALNHYFTPKTEDYIEGIFTQPGTPPELRNLSFNKKKKWLSERYEIKKSLYDYLDAEKSGMSYKIKARCLLEAATNWKCQKANISKTRGNICDLLEQKYIRWDNNTTWWDLVHNYKCKNKKGPYEIAREVKHTITEQGSSGHPEPGFYWDQLIQVGTSHIQRTIYEKEIEKEDAIMSQALIAKCLVESAMTWNCEIPDNKRSSGKAEIYWNQADELDKRKIKL